MPSDKPFVLPPLRGGPPFGAWVDELAEAAALPNRSELVVAGLALLAERHGIRPPPRRVLPARRPRKDEAV